MSWGGAGEFLAMGGYGPFVWGSFAIAALCMLIEPLVAHARHRRALAELKRAGVAARGLGHEAAA
jgi:heme exporter protein D